LRGSETIRLVTLIALRLGIIAFLFGFFFEITGKSDSITPFWNDIVKVGFLLAIASVAAFLLILDKRRFGFLGFLLVFIISLFRLFSILFQTGLRYDVSTHFLLIVLSLYLLARPLKTKHL
jgi:hypothetical protein